MSKDTIRVLPCPFCGEIPKLYDNSEQLPIPIMIKCEAIPCYINPEVSGKDCVEVEAKWNIRDLYRSDANEMKREISFG